MATVLRVIPTKLYDQLESNGYLENEILCEKLKTKKQKVEFEKEPSPKTKIETLNIFEKEKLQVGSGFSASRVCNWTKFEDLFNLVP